MSNKYKYKQLAALIPVSPLCCISPGSQTRLLKPSPGGIIITSVTKKRHQGIQLQMISVSLQPKIVSVRFILCSTLNAIFYTGIRCHQDVVFRSWCSYFQIPVYFINIHSAIYMVMSCHFLLFITVNSWSLLPRFHPTSYFIQLSSLKLSN